MFCLSFLLRNTLPRHWFEHARFEGVYQNAFEGMNELFDLKKPHLAV